MPQISRTSGNICRQRIVGSPLLKHPVASCSIGTALVLLLLSFVPSDAATVTYTNGENNSTPINATGDPNLFLSISSGSAIQSGAITGNGGGFIQKIGDGTLSLTAANTFSGMSVKGGILKIASGGTVSTNIAYVSREPGDMGTLNVDGAGSLLSVTSFLRVADSGAGTLSITNGGAVALGSYVSFGVSNNAATVTVDGPGSSLSGKDLGLNTTGSSLTISNGGSVSDTTAGIIGTASISGGSWANSASLDVGYDGTGTLTQTGGQITAPIVYVGLNDNNGGSLSNGTLNLNGGIVTAGQVARGVVASGTTVTSTLNFNGGTVRLTGDQGALFNGITDVTLNASGATIDTQSFAVATGSNLIGTGGLTKTGSGTLTLTGTNTYTGPTTISAGALQGTTSSLQGNITGSGTLAFDQATSGTYAGLFSGTGSLSKSGSGTVTLSAAQSYTGSTLIAGGTLEVNNSLASPSVSVISGGTLAGTGPLAGAVTVENGGALSPGDSSPGTLTMASLELKDSAILNFELDTPGVVGGGVNDLVSVGTDLTLDGVLNLTKSPNFGAGSYTLFTYGGSLVDHGLSMGIVPGGYNYTINTGTSGQVKLTVDTVGLQFWNGAVTTADGTVHGGDGIWAAGTTNWTNSAGSTSSAWEAGTAVFGGISGTVTVSGTQSVQRMEFINDEYIITGGALDVGAGAELMADDFGTIDSTITGTGGITIAGAGTIALTGSNTYLGGTTLESGILQVGSDDALGAAAGALTIQHGVLFTTATMSTARDVVFDNPDGTIMVDNGTTLTLSGNLSGVGGLLKTGDGTLEIAGTGDINHNVTVQGGMLKITGTLSNIVGEVGDDDNLGVVVVDGPGAVWNVSNLNVIGNTGSGGLEIFNGGHVQNYFGYIGMVAGSFGSALVSGAGSRWDTTAYLVVGDAGEGELAIDEGGAVSDSTGVLGNSSGGEGAVTMNDGTWSNTDDLKVGFQGGGNLTQTDGEISAPIVHVAEIAGSTGELNLNGGTLTTGKVEVGQGTATVNFDGGRLVATGDEADFVTSSADAQFSVLAGGGTIDNNGHAIGIQSPIGGIGALTFTGSGVTTLTGANTYSGGTTVSGGTLKGDTTSLQGNIVNNAAVVFDQSDPDAPTGTYAGVISGTGSLSKAGSGTLFLSEASTYSGGTTINDGTVLVTDHGEDSSSLGSGAVNVGINGTLGGVGFVLGNTTVNGTLAPGDPHGSLGFRHDLLLTDTSTVQIDLLGPSSSDQIGVSGQLTYDGTLSIAFLGDYLPGVGDSFHVFGTVVTPLSNFDAISFGRVGYAGTFDPITGNLFITAIPEPSAWAMMGLGLGIIVLLRRKAGREALVSRSGIR